MGNGESKYEDRLRYYNTDVFGTSICEKYLWVKIVEYNTRTEMTWKVSCRNEGELRGLLARIDKLKHAYGIEKCGILQEEYDILLRCVDDMIYNIRLKEKCKNRKEFEKNKLLIFTNVDNIEC